MLKNNAAASTAQDILAVPTKDNIQFLVVVPSSLNLVFIEIIQRIIKAPLNTRANKLTTAKRIE